MNNDLRLNLVILNNYASQGDYISFEIKSDDQYLNDCSIELEVDINCNYYNLNGKKTMVKIPIATPRIYDFQIPLNFFISRNNEIDYYLILKENNQIIYKEKIFINPHNLVYDFINTIERFYNFKHADIYCDLDSTKNNIWVEFNFEGTGDKADFFVNFSFSNFCEIIFCYSPSFRKSLFDWKMDKIQINFSFYSQLEIKRRLDSFFKLNMPLINVFPEEIDNSLEEVYIILEEVGDKILQSDYESAFSLLKQAESIEDIAEIHYELAKCMTDNDYPVLNILSEFKKANNMDRDNFPLIKGYYYLLENFLFKGLYEKAIDLSNCIMEIDEIESLALYQIGNLFKYYGDYDTSLKFLIRSAQNQENNSDCLKEIADCLRILKHYTEAEKYYKKAFSYSDGDVDGDISIGLAIMFFEKGDINNAKKIAYQVLGNTDDFDICGFNITNPDFTDIFDNLLWQAYIKKYPQMKEVYQRKNFELKDISPRSDDYFV